jgi:DNA-directed RNA polymerase subunit omega
MLDIDIEEALIKKIGGKFKLTSLIQKRMVELNRGARPLVKVEGGTHRQIVYQEIIQDKIVLAPREEVGYTFEEEGARIQAGIAAPSDSGGVQPVGDEPEIYGSDIKKIKEQRIKELAQLLNSNPKP